MYNLARHKAFPDRLQPGPFQPLPNNNFITNFAKLKTQMDKTTIILIVAGMISTGTINTLLNKFQDLQCVANCSTEPLFFAQPLLQTLTMFVGEIICLFIYFAFSKKPSEYVPVDSSNKPDLEGSLQILFLLPTLCDLTATTLMNVGLLHISASIYQMLRGSVVLFTGIFSTLFLGIKHPLYRWYFDLNLGLLW